MHGVRETRAGAHGRHPSRPTLFRETATSPEHAAVLALQRSAGNRATRKLMRQAVETAPAPAAAKISGTSATGDVVTVRMSDGTRWEVTRKRSTTPIVKKRGQFGLGVGGDADRIWLRASWCRGTRGEIKIGGNPQGAAKDVLTNLAKGVATGGDAAEVERIIKAAEIKPFVEWDIQRAGDWRITGGITLTVDRTGITKVEGNIEGKKGPWGGKLGGSGTKDGGWDITVTGTYTPGDGPKTDPDCPRDELLFPYEYSCEHVRDIPASVKPEKRTRTDRFPDHRYVYFKYASDEINPKLTGKGDREAIQALFAADYKLVNVQAFTSPEGLRDPSKSWSEGNRALSGRRAQAAMHMAAEQCLDGGCITGNVSPPKDPELLALDWENMNGTTSEGSGKALEDHVIQMWEQAASDDIREQKTPAAEKRVRAARGRHAKAEVIYEYLRRARLDFERVVERSWDVDVPVPASVKRTSGNCPPDVLQAARSHWAATEIPF